VQLGGVAAAATAQRLPIPIARLRRRRITPRIARRGLESNTRLGRHRWKVERSLAWLLANRRLTVRYERRADILTAFLHLACALICVRKLQPL
jgi:transposase